MGVSDFIRVNVCLTAATVVTLIADKRDQAYVGASASLALQRFDGSIQTFMIVYDYDCIFAVRRHCTSYMYTCNVTMPYQ